MDNPTIDNAESVKNPSPFITFTARTIPATFDTSMSYQEALFALVNYLQTQVTPAINENAKITDEQTKVINELYDFVNHYFENLDVQEEINNKLDEMAASGELEAILQQILNTLRVYDTVDEMIADEAIQNGQRVLCFGYSVKTDNGGGTYTITNEALTGNGLTIIELDNGLFAVKEYSDKIIVADQSVLTPALITDLLNNSVQIVTENPIEVTDTIEITQDGATIKNMEFVGNTDNTKYIIFIKAKDVTVENCKFTGVTGNYLRMENACKYANIVNNTFDGTNGSSVSPLVAWGSSHIKIHGNTFINNNGFNTQFIRVSNSSINDNTYQNEFYYGSYTSTGGETTIQFNTEGVIPNRRVVRIEGEIPTSYTVTYDSETSIASITLSSAIQGVKTVTFRCYRSLEMININSHCKNILISGNTLEGTGDSGIVIGRDYHHNILDPNHTTYDDSPTNINVSNNIIRNCMYSGIANTSVNPQITIEGNTISNYGWGNDGIYSSGVFIPFSFTNFGCIVSENNFSNSSTYRYGETENGIGKYGIVINPSGAPSDSIAYNNYLKSTNKLKCSNNTADESIILHKVYAFSNNVPQLGYLITPTRELDFGVKANTTTADNEYSTISGNGCTVTTGSENDTTYINAAFNESGDRYCSLGTTALRIFKNYNLVITFAAKSDVAGEGAFRCIYGNSTTQKLNADLKLTNEWQTYEYRLLIGEIGTGRYIYPRFVPTSTCRNIRFKDLHFKLEFVD